MPFCSDNASGVSPEILAAITAANAGNAPAYGADGISARLESRFGEVFETAVAVFPVITGTAANALSVSLLAPPYGAVFCHDDAHMLKDACGAPEFYAAGARLVPVGGAAGKIDPAAFSARIAGFPPGFVHSVQPAALTVTQTTEAGTVYRPSEIASLTAIAREHGLGVHMDGARLANAVAAAGATPADLTWRAGVDILSFGASKNGAFAAEAVVLFGHETIARHGARLGYLRKRAGHLIAKLRFVSAQLAAYLEDGLWLQNAARANAVAAQLAAGLATVPGVSLVNPVEANEVFAHLPRVMAEGLEAAGFGFYRWPAGEQPARSDGVVIRLVASFNSDPADADALVAAAAALAGPRGAAGR